MATSNVGTDVRMNLDDALRELGARKDRAVDDIRRTAEDLAERLKLASDARELLPIDFAKADHVVALDFDNHAEVPSPYAIVNLSISGAMGGGGNQAHLTKTFEPGSYRALIIITRTPGR